MADETRRAGRPDAVLFPYGFDPGGTPRAPSDRLHDYLDGVLGCANSRVNDAKLNQDEDGNHWLFAYPNLHDTYLHPEGHPRAKSPRYDWVAQPNGVKFGFLVDDAWRCPPGGKRQAPPGGEFPAVNPLSPEHSPERPAGVAGAPE